MTDSGTKPANYRAYIDLLGEHPGLAGAMYALTGREASVIDGLREAEITADPAEIDAALRTVIRAAQQARKLLTAKEGD